MGRLRRTAVLAIVLLLSACLNPMVPPGRENDPVPTVKLVGSGPVAIRVDGFGGQCTGLSPNFGFILDLDFGLGVGFTAFEDPPGSFTLTLTTAGPTLSPSGTTGPTFSASGIAAAVSEGDRAITFEADLVGETGTEHVNGSIEC